MVNLFEIMRQAQSGAALPALSRQFGLDGADMQRAVDALLPAFSLALQRNAADPNAFAHLIGLVTSGRYAPFFDGSAGASPSAAAANGQDVLSALFGSREVTRQVAGQAAAATGIGVQALQEMMPVLAATLVGGMFRYATVEGFADLLRTWSDSLRAAAAPAPAPRPAAPFGPWSGWFELMNRVTGASPPPQPPPALPYADPFKAWAEIMGGLAGPAPSPAPPAPPPALPPPAPASNPFEALFHMYETGREAQAQHVAALASIIDGAWATGRPDAAR